MSLFKNQVILFVFLFGFTGSSYGQFLLKGHISTTTNNTGLAYSNVLLVNKSGLIKSVMSNDAGDYTFENINKGTYKITVSYLGEKVSTDDFYLSRDTLINIPFISASSKQLSEVQVKEKRPLLERKVDRLLFNVSDAPALQGMDLKEVLSNTPMVKVNEDAISLVGKGEVAIMVNDRILHLSGAALNAYLTSLRSDNVARIEIITNPPAKYDAQGNSGLINIVLKKNTNLGFNGNVKVSYIQRTFDSETGNGVLNYGSDKLSISSSWNHYHARLHTTENENIFGNPTSIYQSDVRKDFNDGNDYNLSMDYRINKKSSVGFMYDLLDGNANMDISSASIYLTNSSKDSTLLTQAAHRNKLRYNTANLYYDLKLDTNGKKLSLIGNFLNNSSNNPVNFTTNNQVGNTDYTVLNTSKTTYQIVSGQADLELPFKNAPSFETGVKYSDISNDADVGYFNRINGDYLIVPDRSNIFHYNEKNYASYVSAAKEFGKIWSLKAGLRYEFTDVSGETPASNEHVAFTYGKLFPSFFASFTPNKQNQFSVNYSRRINRPGFSQLNPFRWYSDPYTYMVGNPQLLPSFSNNFEVSYVYNSNLSITAYYQKTDNASSDVLQTQGTTSVTTYLNFLTNYSNGVNAYYNFNDIKWWQSVIYADYHYSKSVSKLPQFLGAQGSSFSYQINNSFFLNDKKTYSILVNYNQSLPNWVGNIRWSNRGNFTAGINTFFYDKNLQISLVGGDLFHQSVSKGKIFLNNSYQEFNNYYDARRATLSVTYKFGNKKIKVVNKNTKFDEKGRAN